MAISKDRLVALGLALNDAPPKCPMVRLRSGIGVVQIVRGSHPEPASSKHKKWLSVQKFTVSREGYRVTCPGQIIERRIIGPVSVGDVCMLRQSCQLHTQGVFIQVDKVREHL